MSQSSVFKRINEYFDLQMVATSLLAALAFFLASEAFAQGTTTIRIDGSSTVFPITEAMAEEFQTLEKGKTRVTVGISGTGGGFKKFCRGETDIQNASRPITKSEMDACRAAGVKYFELPIAYDAAVVVVNTKNALTEISIDELKKMWAPEAQGKILSWDQVNSKWPKEKLKLYGAGADSGTFDYFTEAVVGKAKSSRGDFTASEDDNTLVTGVANDKNALGYIPMAYYEENKTKLKALAIIGGEKAPLKTAVLPSEKTVKDGTYYPLSRPLFLYISEAAYKKAEVKKFTEYYLSKAETIVPTVKYVALPAAAYTLGLDHLKKAKLGTKFGGEPLVGLKIEELLKKEGTL